MSTNMYDKLTHAKISEKFRLVPYYISVKKKPYFLACLNSFFSVVHYAPTVRYAPPSPIYGRIFVTFSTECLEW